MTKKIDFFDNIVGLTGISANGTLGTSGQVLKSNGTTIYWDTDAASGGDAATLDGYDSTAFARLVGAAFTGSITVNVTGSTPANFIRTDDGTTGPIVSLQHITTTPAVNDITGQVSFLMTDNALGSPTGAGLRGVARDVTAGAASADLHLLSRVSGSFGTRLIVANGIYTVGATGADQGLNTINASNYFDDGVNINTIYLASSSYTASDVLSKLLTVDGSGSGIDADLLDGYQASNLAILAAANIFTLAQTINTNTSPAASPGLTGVILQLSGADGIPTRFWLDSYGAATNYTARRSNGTNASKTALLANDVIMNNSAFGHDGTAYSTTSRGSYQIAASQNWAVGAHGTRLLMVTTADNTTTSSTRWIVENDGSFIYSGGSATGVSTINAVDYFDNGVNINTIYLASASYTAADVLSKLLTVDGSGSGIDADLLDGKNVGTSGNAIPVLDGINNWSALQTMTNLTARTTLTTGISGTLTASHANISVELNGNVTLPNSVFTAGDKTTFDPGTSNRTFTRGSGVTMYVNGVDVASATLAANRTGEAHWRTASVVILSGAFS